MSVGDDLRRFVRQRANFACEFCGVTEVDSGGELTVDHFRPKTRGGGDDPDNLLYCCNRCNQYKAHYWPANAEDGLLWNPRREPMQAHLIPLPDGTLEPATAVGALRWHGFD